MKDRRVTNLAMEEQFTNVRKLPTLLTEVIIASPYKTGYLPALYG